jgi:hypothetical protein
MGTRYTALIMLANYIIVWALLLKIKRWAVHRLRGISHTFSRLSFFRLKPHTLGKKSAPISMKLRRIDSGIMPRSILPIAAFRRQDLVFAIKPVFSAKSKTHVKKLAIFSSRRSRMRQKPTVTR